MGCPVDPGVTGASRSTIGSYTESGLLVCSPLSSSFAWLASSGSSTGPSGDLLSLPRRLNLDL